MSSEELDLIREHLAAAVDVCTVAEIRAPLRCLLVVVTHRLTILARIEAKRVEPQNANMMDAILCMMQGLARPMIAMILKGLSSSCSPCVVDYALFISQFHNGDI